MIIDKFHSNYLIQKGKIRPYVIQDRLDRIAGNLLVKEIDLTLSQVLQDNSPLYFIKKLNIDIAFNLAKMDDGAIARLWTAEIASRITKMLQSIDRPYLEPHKESNVIVFQNRSEYLACFINDLISGMAWDRWYYNGFKDLSVLSRKDIINLTFKQNEEIAEDILMFLAEIGVLDKTLEELAEEDIEVIYSSYLGESYDPDILLRDKDYRRVIQFISEIIRDGILGLPSALPRSFKSCLRIYLLFQKKYQEFKSKASSRLTIENVIFNKRESILTTEIEKSKFADTTKKTIIPYGGLFFLVRPLLETKLNDLINQSQFLREDNISRLNYFLFFLALKIVNQKISEQTNIDPGLFIFAGLERSVPINITKYAESTSLSMNEEFLESLKNVLHTLKEQGSSCLDYINLDNYPDIKSNSVDFETVISLVAELILKVFARRLRGFERSSPEYIFRNFLYRPSEITLNRDLIHIKLSKKPMDIVLRMSGMLEDINSVPWLNNRSVKFMFES